MTEPKFDADKQLVAELIAALEEMIARHEEPAGLTPEIVADKAEFSKFWDEQTARAEATVARARAALAKARGETP